MWENTIKLDLWDQKREKYRVIVDMALKVLVT